MNRLLNFGKSVLSGDNSFVPNSPPDPPRQSSAKDSPFSLSPPVPPDSRINLRQPSQPTLSQEECLVVTRACQSLVRSVQSLVIAAREKTPTWQKNLLSLLAEDVDGGGVEDVDIRELERFSKYVNFVQKGIENELPANLIHCLRLLRVVEMTNPPPDNQSHLPTKNPTLRVSSLLSTLCLDSSVGECLRPHLFGLLSLTTAPGYLNKGEHSSHILQGAGDVVAAICKGCFNPQLVWFLHDRKIVKCMIEDVKELLGYKTADPAPSSGTLWQIALTTIVNIVMASLSHNSDTPLLGDFVSNEGFETLHYAITHCDDDSNSLSALLGLLVKLSTTTAVGENVDSAPKNDSSFGLQSRNVQSLDLLATLVRDSMPFEFDHDDVKTLSLQSAQLALFRKAPTKPMKTQNDNFRMEVLVIILQLFSSHTTNYSMIEPQYNLLTQYLVHYPLFEDPNLKTLALKTLEFVCTGISDGTPAGSLDNITNTYTSMCQALLDALTTPANLSSVSQPTTTHSIFDDKLSESIDAYLYDISSVTETIMKLRPVNYQL